MDGASVGGVYPPVPGPKSTWSVRGSATSTRTAVRTSFLRDPNANVDILSYGSGPTPSDYPMAASAFSYTAADHVTHPIDATWQAAGVGDVRGGCYASIVWVQPATGLVAVTGFAFESPPSAPYTTSVGTLPPAIRSPPPATTTATARWTSCWPTRRRASRSSGTWGISGRTFSTSRGRRCRHSRVGRCSREAPGGDALSRNRTSSFGRDREAAHHRIANRPKTPIRMSKAATVMAIGRMGW